MSPRTVSFRSPSTLLRSAMAALVAPLAAGAVGAAGAAGAPAQSSAFAPGDLLLNSPATKCISIGCGSILRIDPLTGAATELVALDSQYAWGGNLCYDPYRDAVLFYAAIAGQSARLHLLDSSGALSDLGYSSITLHALAPGAGGKIYVRTATGSQVEPLRYLDAANVLQVLFDSSGTTPFTLPGIHELSDMAYDAGSNALLLAFRDGTPAACGGPSAGIVVKRLPLSADGTRVAGPVGCAEFVVDPLGAARPVGFSRMPGGQFMLVVDTNSNEAQARMLVVDPVTLAISPFASNGPYLGAAATNAGTWSSALGGAVVLDTFNDVLRAFGPGGGGGGAIVPSSHPVSASGSGEVAVLREVGFGGCAAGVGFYCTPKTTSSGCVPALSATGSPSASAGGGFVIQASQVEAKKAGIVLYSRAGAAATPFQGGTLCLQTPIKRTPPATSGGSGACTGVFAFDFNAHVASGADPGLVAGEVVHAQVWSRDPAHPVAGTGLTGGVVFTLCP